MIIDVQHLSRRFGSFVAVDDASFGVQPGEIFGWLGANGAGKSTTIRMLTGLLGPTSGDAIVAGHRLSRDPEGIKRNIGYMSQRFSLYLDLTVDDNLRFFGGAYGLGGRALSARIDEVCALTGITDRHATTGALPGGTRQRLALATALLHRPKIVFLDEPTAGVAPQARRDFWTLIRALARDGTTVFVTTHYMDEAEYCARIGLMASGRLVALDTPAELKRKHVPGRLYDVRGPDLTRRIGPLRDAPGVVAVEPFGAGLHLRLADLDEDGAHRLLAAQGVQATVTPIEPTLEDVFLAVAAGGAR